LQYAEQYVLESEINNLKCHEYDVILFGIQGTEQNIIVYRNTNTI